MQIELEPARVSRAFLGTVVVLLLLNCIMLACYFVFSDYDVRVVSDYFDFGIEGNIPTFYSAFAILVCAGVLGLITRHHWHGPGGKRAHWLGLCVIFVILALDEAAEIHEWASNILDTFMTGRGVFYYLWVVPYGIFVLVLGLVYLRFVWSLPPITRRRFCVAGALFLAGALGFEMLSAGAADAGGTDTIIYSLLYTIEELLEMLGIVLFLHALLCYLAEETGGVVLKLASPSSRNIPMEPAVPHIGHRNYNR